MSGAIVRVVGGLAGHVATEGMGSMASGVRPFLSRQAVEGLGFRPATIDRWITDGKVVTQHAGGIELFPVTMHQPLATKAKSLTAGGTLDPTSFATVDQLASELGVKSSKLAKRISGSGLQPVFHTDQGTAAWERSVLDDANVLGPARSSRSARRAAEAPAPGEPAAPVQDAEEAAHAIPDVPEGPVVRPTDRTERFNNALDQAQHGVRSFFGDRRVQLGLAFGSTLAAPIAVGQGMGALARNSGAGDDQRTAFAHAAELTLATAGLAMGRWGATRPNRLIGYTLAAGGLAPFAPALFQRATQFGETAKGN